MLPLHLQPESHIPLYIQLRDQLRSLVHAGDLRPGDRIPASRELAQMLGVHRTTVANAYAELESEGLIRGHGPRTSLQQRKWTEDCRPRPRVCRTAMACDGAAF
jgi:DNA-binding transcriptional regulator YhcF (GntR family)